jgi:hypothetical protein
MFSRRILEPKKRCLSEDEDELVIPELDDVYTKVFIKEASIKENKQQIYGQSFQKYIKFPVQPTTTPSNLEAKSLPVINLESVLEFKSKSVSTKPVEKKYSCYNIENSIPILCKKCWSLTCLCDLPSTFHYISHIPIWNSEKFKEKYIK